MDFSFSQFPYDLVLIALVTILLILRLRSVLGKKIGTENPFRNLAQVKTSAAGAIRLDAVHPPVQDDLPPPKTDHIQPPPSSAVDGVLEGIRLKDPDFSPDKFMTWSEDVFRQTVIAFAAGDRKILKTYLTPRMFEVFQHAISDRETDQHVQHTEIKSLQSVELTDANLSDKDDQTIAQITLKFNSDQISYVVSSDGKVVSGVDAVVEFNDYWIFERNLTTQGNWFLVSAKGV